MSSYMLQPEEFLPKLAKKDLVPVTNYGSKDPMQSKNMIKVELGHYDSSERARKWHEMSRLAQSILHYKNGVFHLRLWQTLNEVHRNICPNYPRDRKRLKQSSWC